MLSVSLIQDIINVRFAWVGTGYRRPQARVGHYFKWVGQSPEWVGHGLPGLGLEPPLADTYVVCEVRWAEAVYILNMTLAPLNSAAVKRRRARYVRLGN